VNTHPLSAEDAKKTVDWFDDTGSEKVTGSLVRVDCAGKQLRLGIKNDEGKTLTLLVPDPQQFELKGAETLTCGAQRPRRVTVSYKPASKTATGLEFQR
jgi:hypothetical protein